MYLKLIFVFLSILLIIKCENENTDSDENKNDLNGGNIRFEIIGNTSHLFKDEDFEKVEAQLLYVENSTDQQTATVNDDLNVTKIENKTNKNRLECTFKNYTSNSVRLVNGSTLTNILAESNASDCFIVMFYVPWCKFSTRFAPNYNALPRAFNNLDILAFDVSKSIGYNTKFGTSAVPMILIFQHKNVIAKFNHTQKNLTDLIDFVANHTGLNHSREITNIENDFEGPVPTVAVYKFDYALMIAWIFLILVLCNFIVKKFNLLNIIKNFYLKTFNNTVNHVHVD